MSLITKYRPKKLGAFKGNNKLIKEVKNILSSAPEDRTHAFLIVGPRGCGKTTLARIIASELECNQDHDFVELDIGEKGGVAAARSLKKNISYRPLASKSRVYLLDECHKLTKPAQEALLKITEEPPSHAYIIFSTTDPQLLKATLVDRCTVLHVAPLSFKECIVFLKQIIRKEKKKLLPEKVLAEIADRSEGRPRSALKLLEKVIDLSDDEMMAKLDEQKIVEYDTIELCRILAFGSSWPQVANIIKKLKNQEPESLRRMVMSYTSKILLSEKDVDKAFHYYMIACNFRKPFYDNGANALVVSAFGAFNDIAEYLEED